MQRSISKDGKTAILVSEKADRKAMVGCSLFRTKTPFGVIATEYEWFYYEKLGTVDLKISEILLCDWEIDALKTTATHETCPLCEEYVKQLVKVNDHRIEHDELCEACYEKEDALAMAHEELERTSDWNPVYREVV